MGISLNPQLHRQELRKAETLDNSHASRFLSGKGLLLGCITYFSRISKVITKEAVNELSNKFTSKDTNGKISYIAYPNKINNTMKILLNSCVLYGEEIINPAVIELAGI